MALLQIAEPGQSPNPHHKHVALGIDFGTTHSLVAARKSGVNQCLTGDQDNNSLLPSIVAYGPAEQIIVGADAKSYDKDDQWVVIHSIKRFIGRSSQEVQDYCATYPVAFTWDYSSAELPKIKIPGGAKSAIDIATDIFKTLKQRVIQHFGVDDINALEPRSFPSVITVPAYFDDAQRQATRAAALLAGLDVQRLINEPTAAALAYGLEKQSNSRFLIYDLGGGTFDVTLLEQSDNIFEVLGTAGNTLLGGDDIDQALAEHLVARYLSSNQTNQLTKNNWAQLQLSARQAKESLSKRPKTQLIEPLLADEPIKITQTELEAIFATFIQQTQQLISQVLRDTESQLDEISEMVLVGGSTRSPILQQALEKHYPIPVAHQLSPDEVVALGALRLCRKLVGEDAQAGVLLDVCPLSLGLETMGGIVEKIIPRNTPIPVTKTQEFTTFKNNQTALLLHVVQGERETVDNSRSLAKFELRGIPPLASGVPRIQVVFTIDENGVLSVSAQELSTGIQADTQIKPSQGLSPAALEEMLRSSIDHAAVDINQRQALEVTIEAQRLVQACEYALAADANLLDAAPLKTLQAAKTYLSDLIEQQAESSVLQAGIDRLSEQSETLAGLRMNKAIKSALSGQSIDQMAEKEKI